MKTQTELLQGTDIPTDELVGYELSRHESDLIAVAEGIAFNEWSNVCNSLGLVASKDSIPENYDTVLQRAGRWTLDYPKID